MPNTQTSVMKQRCLHLWRSREGEVTNIRIRQHSSDCLLCHTKSKVKKVMELVKG